MHTHLSLNFPDCFFNTKPQSFCFCISTTISLISYSFLTWGAPLPTRTPPCKESPMWYFSVTCKYTSDNILTPSIRREFWPTFPLSLLSCLFVWSSETSGHLHLDLSQRTFFIPAMRIPGLTSLYWILTCKIDKHDRPSTKLLRNSTLKTYKGRRTSCPRLRPTRVFQRYSGGSCVTMRSFFVR